MVSTTSRQAKKTAGDAKIVVLNPACTNNAVARVPLAPRTFDSLAGKTVYLVDIGWGGPEAAYDVFQVIEDRLAGRFPGITTRLVRKKGFFSADDPDLWEEVKEKGDACIIGISCWDACAAAVSRFASTLENMGIPTAPCTGENVGEYIKTWDRQFNSGMPLRFTVFPLPIAGMPREVHETYVDGRDPLTGEPILEEIIGALTKPLTAEEKLTGTPASAVEARLLPADTEANLQELFKAKDWTDYLPIVLPTEVRVREMLKGTSHPADEVVKTIMWPGGARQMTVEKVAACAVMAGAKPKYLPVILALSTMVPFGNSTTSMSNMIIVNGPVRKEIGMNSGIHAMGPYNEANAVIGRAFTLLSKTAGNLHAGVTAFSAMGSTIQYNNCCYAENEEALPEGWQPIHVQFGYKPEDSVVTVGTGWSLVSSVGEVQLSYPPHLLIRDYMRSLSASGSAALLCCDPLVAKILHDQQGFATKEALGEWLAKNVKITAGQYWGNGVVATFGWSLGQYGVEPYAGWQKVPPEELIAPYINSRAVNTVVVGGQTNNVWYITDFRIGKGASIDAWR